MLGIHLVLIFSPVVSPQNFDEAINMVTKSSYRGCRVHLCSNKKQVVIQKKRDIGPLSSVTTILLIWLGRLTRLYLLRDLEKYSKVTNQQQGMGSG
jgi:hypothetical protein